MGLYAVFQVTRCLLPYGMPAPAQVWITGEDVGRKAHSHAIEILCYISRDTECWSVQLCSFAAK